MGVPSEHQQPVTFCCAIELGDDAMVEAQETNASKLSLLQRHREARELLVKIQSDAKDVSERRRPQSACCSDSFEKRPQLDRPKSAAPGGARETSATSAAAAANVHFRPVPNPLPPHLGGGSSGSGVGSAPGAPRKRPLSAFPTRVAMSQVGRSRPASACGVRERFAEACGVFCAFCETKTFIFHVILKQKGNQVNTFMHFIPFDLVGFNEEGALW